MRKHVLKETMGGRVRWAIASVGVAGLFGGAILNDVDPTREMAENLTAPAEVLAAALLPTPQFEHAEPSVAMGEEGWKTVNRKFSIERQVDQLKEHYLDQLQAYGKS